jgi:oligosaccharide repeat unit polymerase
MYLTISLVVSFLIWSAARPGKIRMKHLIMLALAVFIFMVIYNQFVDVYVSREFRDSKIPKRLSFLESPYLYVVGSWPAMSAVIQSPPEQPRKGFVTFHVLWKILGAGLKIIPKVPEDEPGVDIGSIRSYNVYSLIGGIYWDFGLFGAILGCFFLGFISTSLYIAARKSGNWTLFLLSSIFTYGLFISFFAYYFRFNLVFLSLYTSVFGFSFQKVIPLLSRTVKSTLIFGH